VNQRGGTQGVIDPLPAQLTLRQAVKMVVHGRENAIERLGVAPRRGRSAPE
jgi:hypothetical protein